MLGGPDGTMQPTRRMSLPPSSPRELLAVRQLSKRFPGVTALHQVELSLQRGEVLAVIGENGAGKSTLMKIIGGVQQPDEGEIFVEGRPVHLDSVRAAERHGIALIHQELNLADNLDVAANLFLGREPQRFGFVDRRRLYADAAPLLSQVGLSCPPHTIVGSLSLAKLPSWQTRPVLAPKRQLFADATVYDRACSGLIIDTAHRVIGTIRSACSSLSYDGLTSNT